MSDIRDRAARYDNHAFVRRDGTVFVTVLGAVGGGATGGTLRTVYENGLGATDPDEMEQMLLAGDIRLFPSDAERGAAGIAQAEQWFREFDTETEKRAEDIRRRGRA